MGESCDTCGKEINGVYHCMKCCTDFPYIRKDEFYTTDVRNQTITIIDRPYKDEKVANVRIQPIWDKLDLEYQHFLQHNAECGGALLNPIVEE